MLKTIAVNSIIFQINLNFRNFYGLLRTIFENCISNTQKNKSWV